MVSSSSTIPCLFIFQLFQIYESSIGCWTPKLMPASLSAQGKFYPFSAERNSFENGLWEILLSLTREVIGLGPSMHIWRD